MSAMQTSLQAVRERIVQAAQRASRPADAVVLLAVSKTFDAEAVLRVADLGQRAFGENYLQEALDKMDAVRALAPEMADSLEWHFIGPIQSNKTRPIAERFDWVHSVDREKIARRLSEQRPPSSPALQVCLQVNVSGEASKSGVLPADLPALALAVAALPGLKLRGLMAIPEPEADFEAQRQPFAVMRGLLYDLRERGLDVDVLSMGMSGDLEAAVIEGATMVRVGTAIFGIRT